MKYEDYVVEKLMALEKFVIQAKNKEEDIVKIGKFLVEAYHLARLRGYGTEIASVGYYVSTSVEIIDEKVNFYPERIDVKLLIKYLKEYSAVKTINDFFFNKKDNNAENENSKRRTAGFGSDL